MILSDAVLRAIAAAAPQNLTALHAIPGMGPTKVDRYGADLIALCRGTAPALTLNATTSTDNVVVAEDDSVILSGAQRSRRTPTPSTSPKPSAPFQPQSQQAPATAALESQPPATNPSSSPKPSATAKPPSPKPPHHPST